MVSSLVELPARREGQRVDADTPGLPGDQTSWGMGEFMMEYSLEFQWDMSQMMSYGGFLNWGYHKMVGL